MGGRLTVLRRQEKKKDMFGSAVLILDPRENKERAGSSSTGHGKLHRAPILGVVD